MFVPIIAGSDKTTVSVATGGQEYHPMYASLGNITNTARRGHGNGVVLVAFLPIPKSASDFNFFNSLSLSFPSQQTPAKTDRFSDILSPAVPQMSRLDLHTPQGTFDEAINHEVP